MATVLVAATLAIAPLAPAQAAAQDVFVGDCDPDGVATIQDGIEAVRDGGTVWVCPGTYAGALVSDRKRVTVRNLPVRNSPAPLIVGAGEVGNGIVVRNSPGTRVRGLRIQAPQFGVAVESSPGSRVRNVAVSGATFGVSVIDSDDAKVSDVLVDGASFGVTVEESDRVVVADDRIVGTTFGIVVSKSDAPVLQRNGALRSRFGYVVDDTDGAVLDGNRAKSSDFGATITRSTRLRVDRLLVRSAAVVGVNVGQASEGRFADVLVRGGGIVDVLDATSGSGTGGTASRWVRARCTTSSPAAICGDAPSDAARSADLSDLRRELERQRSSLR